MNKTDIVILTAGKDNLIEKCLESIDEYTDSEKIGKVVVGCTTDYALELVLKTAGKFKFALEARRMEYNFAKCCNALAKQCHSEVILFMNDDIELTEDAISPCLNTLDDRSAGTVGICLRFPDGTIQHGGIYVHWRDYMMSGIGHIGMKSPRSLPDLYTFGNTGAFLMLRKADFDAIGGFNECYECCYEDVELNGQMMVMLKKHNITLNTVNAIHRESSTRKQSFGKYDGSRLVRFLNTNAPVLTRQIVQIGYKKGAIFEC